MAIHSGFSQQIWWFSIVMLIYQRVVHAINHLVISHSPGQSPIFSGFSHEERPCSHSHASLPEGNHLRGVLQFPWLGRTWGLPRTLRTYRKKFNDGWTSWPEPGNKDQKRIQHLWVDMGCIIGRYRDGTQLGWFPWAAQERAWQPALALLSSMVCTALRSNLITCSASVTGTNIEQHAVHRASPIEWIL